MLKTHSPAGKNYAMMEIRLAGGICPEELMSILGANELSCDVVLNADNPRLMGIFCKRNLEKKLTTTLNGRAIIENKAYITDKERRERLARIPSSIEEIQAHRLSEYFVKSAYWPEKGWSG
jgi:hypothetical protein